MTVGLSGIVLVGACGGLTPPPPPAPPAIGETMARMRSLPVSSNPADNAEDVVRFNRELAQFARAVARVRRAPPHWLDPAAGSR